MIVFGFDQIDDSVLLPVDPPKLKESSSRFSDVRNKKNAVACNIFQWPSR